MTYEETAEYLDSPSRIKKHLGRLAPDEILLVIIYEEDEIKKLKKGLTPAEFKRLVFGARPSPPQQGKPWWDQEEKK